MAEAFVYDHLRTPRGKGKAAGSLHEVKPVHPVVGLIGGLEDLILAGGVESMSRVALASHGGAWASDPATALTTGFVPQGIGADLIATLEGWSRADVDAYAAESHHRAAKAWANGYFANSVVPVV